MLISTAYFNCGLNHLAAWRRLLESWLAHVHADCGVGASPQPVQSNETPIFSYASSAPHLKWGLFYPSLNMPNESSSNHIFHTGLWPQWCRPPQSWKRFCHPYCQQCIFSGDGCALLLWEKFGCICCKFWTLLDSTMGPLPPSKMTVWDCVSDTQQKWD